MGVKNLWKVFAPYGSQTSLIDLQQKRIALDLSCWLCETQLQGDKFAWKQPRLYLRNIFFRSATLLIFNVTPLCVMDGDPPEVKRPIIAKRNQMRHKKKPESAEGVLKETSKKKITSRSRHKQELRECEEMLKLLGLSCLWSDGEGEALCALLDKEKIVDGIITQDSDAFLYGARKVYKNFSIQNSCGSVEVYQMCDLEKKLNLTREKLVALSLLSGCDYYEAGVHGIGAVRALKYLSGFEGDIIERFRELKQDKILEKYIFEKNNCQRCSNPRKHKAHTVSGIAAYHNLNDQEKSRIDFEIDMIGRIGSDETFPDEATINEYMNFTQNIQGLDLDWKKPNITGLIAFMNAKCGWCVCYGLKKVVPLGCRWALMNSSFSDFEPIRILKKRVQKGVPSFDVHWNSHIKLPSCKCLFPEESFYYEAIITTEPQVLVAEKCRSIHDKFLAQLDVKKLSKKKTRGKKGQCEIPDDSIDALISDINRLSIVEKTTDQVEDKVDLEHPIDTESHLPETNPTPDDSENESSSNDIDKHETKSILDSSSTVEYDFSDYEIDESLILESIISRREYY